VSCIRFPYAWALLATAPLTGCVVEPVEYFTVQLRVQDSGGARGLLAHASPSRPVVVSLSLANYGQEVVTYEVPCPVFYLTDDHGAEVGPPTDSCVGSTTGRFALWPGESATFVSQWAGEGSDGSLLPIGAYGFGSRARRVDRAYSIDTGIAWVCLVPDGYTPPPGPPTGCTRPSPADPGNSTFGRSERTWRPTDQTGARPHF
jgi:hypothetical protein